MARQGKAQPEGDEKLIEFILTPGEATLFARAMEGFALQPHVDHEPVFEDIATDTHVALAFAADIRRQAGIEREETIFPETMVEG